MGSSAWHFSIAFAGVQAADPVRRSAGERFGPIGNRCFESNVYSVYVQELRGQHVLATASNLCPKWSFDDWNSIVKALKSPYITISDQFILWALRGRKFSVGPGFLCTSSAEPPINSGWDRFRNLEGYFGRIGMIWLKVLE